MTTILDDNCRRLLRTCTPPRLTEADLDRALARFEGRRRPAPAHGRVVAAAAAVLLIAVLLVWPSPPTPTIPATQATPDDIAQLIKDLGAPETREKAAARLIAIGPPALAPLERALYHEDPEIRVQSQAVAKIVRRGHEIRPTVDFVLAAIKIVRTRWSARDFTDFDKAVVEAFHPEVPDQVRYVPRRTIEEFFDTQLPGVKMVPAKKDALTPALVAALEKNDGLVFVGRGGAPVDLSEIVLFTLPDKVGWSAYVVLHVGGIETAVEGLRYQHASSEEDLGLFVRLPLFTPREGGGLTVGALDPKSPLAAFFRKGDLLRTLDDKPLAAPKDLAPMAERGYHTLAMERQGKPFLIEMRCAARVLLKLSPKAEPEAQRLLELADQTWPTNPDRALELYTDFIARFGGSELYTKERRAQILDRMAEAMSRKR